MSAPRCKVGDLAVITSDPAYNGLDVGKLVEVIAFDCIDEDGDTFWDCKSLGGPLMGADVETGIDGLGDDITGIPDKFLRPIRPSAEPESTETREELTA